MSILTPEQAAKVDADASMEIRDFGAPDQYPGESESLPRSARILDLLEEVRKLTTANETLRRSLTRKDGRAEVRRNSDGTLDEIVGHGFFHLEQMADDSWWMRLTTVHGDVDCTLFCKGSGRRKIYANCEDFQQDSAASAATTEANEDNQ